MSCLTTPGVGCPGDGLLPVPLTVAVAVEGGAGGSGTQNFAYQKWPEHIFSTVNFDGHFGLGGGGVGTRPWWLALLACGGAYWPWGGGSKWGDPPPILRVCTAVLILPWGHHPLGC